MIGVEATEIAAPFGSDLVASPLIGHVARLGSSMPLCTHGGLDVVNVRLT